MCSFQDEQTVLVCPAAVDRVRTCLHEAFGEIVQCMRVDGQGTLFQLLSGVDSEWFQTVAREAIATVQDSFLT